MPTTPTTLSLLAALSVGWLGCIEGGDLALSAGAPVTGVVQGTITDCGVAVPEAQVNLLVQQNESGQARPVDAELGPVTTDVHGTYSLEVAPGFAVPGAALVRLRVRPPGGDAREFPDRTIQLSLGQALDTLRLDADLGTATGRCR